MARRDRPAARALPAMVIVVLCAATPARADDRGLTWPVVDQYGYAAFHSATGTCTSAFVDISSIGSRLTPVAAGSSVATDDGGAIVNLVEPWDLYGRALKSLVVSTNGYLAAAGSLLTDAGGDFSPDCPMPAVPEPGPGATARVAVLHGDLEAGPAGAIHSHYFATCPRVSEALGPEPCSVIQWTGWRRVGAPSQFDFQAVLYHTSAQLALQYTVGADVQVASVGLQDADARRGLTIGRCPDPPPVAAPAAICVFDPRFPVSGPTSELEVQLDGAPGPLGVGGLAEWSVSVVNHGPTPVADASVAVTPTPGLLCTWECTTDGGASCRAQPADAPFSDGTLTLGAGQEATYRVGCVVSDLASGDEGIDVAAATPGGFHDPGALPNTAVSRLPIIHTDRIFGDGFELELNPWSGARP